MKKTGRQGRFAARPGSFAAKAAAKQDQDAAFAAPAWLSYLSLPKSFSKNPPRSSVILIWRSFAASAFEMATFKTPSR